VGKKPSRSHSPSPGAPRRVERSAPLAQNRRARHAYEILETLECGIALTGAEIKSVRAGKVQLADAFVRIKNGEMWLHGCHIAHYPFASGELFAPDPSRPRKLLAHRREIDSLAGSVSRKSLTLVPLSIYLVGGKAKVEVALARGRTLYDRRRVLAERDAKAEIERAKALARAGRLSRTR
jgi:SsrA-binding protein